MTLRTLLLLSCLLPAAHAADNWQQYQAGSALALALDPDAIALVNDGLVRFRHQERFTEPQSDERLAIKYRIRVTEGRADCKKFEYAFINADYFGGSGKHVYSQMFPLQRYNWAFERPVAGSVADTMLRLVCRLAPNAPRLKIE